MSEENCTPGNWIAINGKEDEVDRWSVVVAGEKQWLIATVENGAPGDSLETEGINARLMAASKDLLAACKLILEDLEDRLLDTTSPSSRQTLEIQIGYLSEAVKKAEGDA